MNYTRDAVEGLAKQLDRTSIMTWRIMQHQMALDMLLAEKGGVCKIFGTLCCTFIPNNTAPDGSVTRAIRGLTTLTKELAENSRVDYYFTNMLQFWFGKWTTVIVSALGAVAAILILCGCCCILCPT